MGNLLVDLSLRAQNARDDFPCFLGVFFLQETTGESPNVSVFREVCQLVGSLHPAGGNPETEDGNRIAGMTDGV